MAQYTLDELIHPVGNQFIVAAWEEDSGRYYAKPSRALNNYREVYGKTISAISDVAQRFNSYETAEKYASLNYSIRRDESSS